MLTIVEGSIEKVKAEMKQAAKWKADELKSVKNKIKSWKDAEKKAAKEERRATNDYSKELDSKLKSLEEEKDRYSSKSVPVSVGEIVINFAVYQSAMKKLKGLKSYPEEISGRELIIRYQDGASKGKIHLYDISELYRELKAIPRADIQYDAQEA